MARPLTGHEHLERAQAALESAATADELRRAQAVLIPLKYGLSIEETAGAIGRSPSWVAHARRRFFGIDRPHTVIGAGRGGRRRSRLTVEEEIQFTRTAVINHVKRRFGGISVRHDLRELLAERFVGGVAESTITSILGRVAAVWFPGGYGAKQIANEAYSLVRQWIEEHEMRKKKHID